MCTCVNYVFITLECYEISNDEPAPKRVAAFPPNVIPADPDNNYKQSMKVILES